MDIRNIKAVILAGGYGTRIRKVVFDRPKSMIPIAGIPFLEHQIRVLKNQGLSEIIICVSYMSDKIKSYFGDGKKFGVNITYSEEEVPLGTAGAIKKAEKYINNTFFVLNGDSYSDIDLKDFLEFHKLNKGKFSMSLTKANHAVHYGGVKLEGLKIVNFLEKEIEGESIINSGVYLFEPDIFQLILPGKNVSLEKEIFNKLVESRDLHGYLYNGYFMDIGRPETYELFRRDFVRSLIICEDSTIREALVKMEKSGVSLIIINDSNGKFLKVVTDKEINKSLVHEGLDLSSKLEKIILKNNTSSNINATIEQKIKLFDSGLDFLPILDDQGNLHDLEFKSEEIISRSFPIVRGRAPLRISFAGGGTDLPYFFDKHGGAVVNATINKYCYVTAVKRADTKIIIDSDLSPGNEIIVESLENLQYDGKFDLLKAVIKKMRPDFGIEIYIHNDIPPGRGLGSSASFAVLIASILNYLMDLKLDDYNLAEIAFKAEREELGIKGGWQDQYATVTGGFNFMEFNSNKSLVYPLRLKEEVINELKSHLVLCYVGRNHSSSEVHTAQENNFKLNEEDITNNLKRLKDIAIEIRDALLTNQLETFGNLLHESWQNKRKLNHRISNSIIDILYEEGLKHGAYGGKLLGAGDGGYILFFYQPKRRNELKDALSKFGGELMDFDFDFSGTKIWSIKNKF